MTHLYVHVPFCVRRCSYCDFSIAVRKRIPAREYVDAVLAELRSADPGLESRLTPGRRRGVKESHLGARLPRGTAPGSAEAPESLETLYLGGGTPSLLPPEAIAALLHDLALTFRNPQSAMTLNSPSRPIRKT